MIQYTILFLEADMMQGYKSILKSIVPMVLILLLLLLLLFNYGNDFLLQIHLFLSNLKNVNTKDVGISLALYLLSVYIFAERWKLVLNSLGYDLKTSHLFPVIFGAIPINNLTPANRIGGEPLRMMWVKKDFGVNYSDAFVSILFERFVEAIPVLLMMGYVISTMLPFIKTYFSSIYLVYLLLASLIILFPVYLLKSTIKKYLNHIILYQYKLRKTFFSTLFLSSTVWLLDILRLKFITLSLGLQLPLKVIVVLSLMYLILGSIPLSAGGLGVVEGGLIMVLNFFGISVVVAAGIVMIERFISYILASLIGSVFLLHYGGLKLWKESKLHL
jgi:hypothetical protein